MKVIVVLSFDLQNPEDIVQVVKAINPPSLPYFAGEARITNDPWASTVTDWLDAEDTGAKIPGMVYNIPMRNPEEKKQ